MAFAKSLCYFMFFLFVKLGQEYLNWNNTLGDSFAALLLRFLGKNVVSVLFRLQTCVQNSWARFEI